ncbi:hypothetical protein FKM82_002661 [Ascaphus truei]
MEYGGQIGLCSLYSSSTDEITQKREDIGRFIRKAYDITGIHPIIVITRRGNENTDRIFTEFGRLGATHRVVLENYTENNQTRTEVADNLILKFLSRCIREADRGIRMRENQDRQQILVTQRRAQIKEETDVQMEEKKKLENRVRELEQEREQKPEQELSRKRCSIS